MQQGDRLVDAAEVRKTWQSPVLTVLDVEDTETGASPSGEGGGVTKGGS